MRLVTPFVALLFAFLAGTIRAQTLVGPVTNAANGHLYYLLNGYVTWANAESAALVLSGHLATIRGADDNQWLQNAFRPAVGSAGPLWIGLNDQAVEDTFQWSSGFQLTYTNWEPGAPDDALGSEDAVYFSSSGLWNDTLADFIGLVEGAIIEVVPAPPFIVRLQLTTNAIISWNSVSNTSYRVEFNSLLPSTTWTQLGSNITATSTNTSTFDPAPLVDQRFYRVICLP
jgi:hypothetical protein